MGLELSDFDADFAIELWPDTAESFAVFQRLRTQWRIGMSGPTGLDYAAVPIVFDLCAVGDRLAVFDDIRVMESAALDEMHKP